MGESATHAMVPFAEYRRLQDLDSIHSLVHEIKHKNKGVIIVVKTRDWNNPSFYANERYSIESCTTNPTETEVLLEQAIWQIEKDNADLRKEQIQVNIRGVRQHEIEAQLQEALEEIKRLKKPTFWQRLFRNKKVNN